MKNDTFYQTGRSYDPSLVCCADYVKLCVGGDTARDTDGVRALIETFTGAHPPLEVNIDFTPSVDHGGDYSSGKADGTPHEGDVVCRRDGTRWQFGLLPGLPYMFPSPGWNAYLAGTAVSAAKAGASGITLQEIGVFGDTGYEEAFRCAWRDFYGFDWPGQALWDDKKYYYMGQYLRSRYMLRQCAEILGAVKSECPSVKRVIANHTLPAYYPFSNAAPNHDIMALPEVTGFEAQTWSNTLMIPCRVKGVTGAHPLITGLLEYGYWAGLSKQYPSKDMAFITDPKGDGFDGVSLDECVSLYRAQLASQLIWDNVYKYNVCVWPDRAYSHGFGGKPASTADFNTVINNISSVQCRIGGDSRTVTPNRGVKLAMLLTDTACNQCGGPDGGITNSGLFGMFSPFIENGALCDIIPAGEVDDEADIFSDYDLITVSFDTMKPMSCKLLDRLAEYSRHGGILLIAGSLGNSYDSITGDAPCGLGWWLGEGRSDPAEALLARCGIDEPNTGSRQYDVMESCVPGITAAYANHGFGIAAYTEQPSERFAEADGSDAMFSLAVKLLAKCRKKLGRRDYISYRRGNIVCFAASCGDITVDLDKDELTRGGFWLDLFDASLTCRHTITVKAGSSALLIDVSRAMRSAVPSVLFATGNSPSVIERPDITEIKTACPDDTVGTVKLYVPRRYSVKSVNAEYSFDDQSRELLIRFNGKASGVTLRAEYNIL